MWIPPPVRFSRAWETVDIYRPNTRYTKTGLKAPSPLSGKN